ncbi:MAG: hypothetical protein ABIH23_13635 [bacterium]
MIWKRKPYWSWGRLLHFGEAFGVTLAMGLWIGDAGVVIGVVGSVVLGALWEIWNHWHPKGCWMFADIVDFLFFVAGAFAAAELWVFVLGG